MFKILTYGCKSLCETDVGLDDGLGSYLLPHLHLKLKSIRSLFDKFLSFLSVSSLFIAIIAFLLPYFSFLLYEVQISFKLLIASFLVSFATYNINKLTDIEEDAVNVPERAGFIAKNKRLVIWATVASFIVALSLSFLQNPLSIFIILFPFFMGVIYSIKISNFRLKDIMGIKNIVVALSWAVLGAFIPLAVSFRDYLLISLIFYFFFIKCFINTVVFDVRDIEGDRMSGVKTIPVFFGRSNSKNLLLGLNSTLLVWLAFSCFMGFFRQYLVVLIFCIFYGYWYILYFCKDKLKIGTSVDLLVDGEWMIIAMLAIAATLL
ncbi:MAG: UbiA family prenyltransferase [Methanocellales archaeon]|nr:UbiA family prenyltransferase [Methanocellales archaeon]MDD3292174.1 UbiA family prenyltransferase [Methanocellales archaeon]MDD5235759.1 UbiA family prenyltransferase [Methanocellales archaeon]MDD5485824.1 UbiA family prenyltransferase [Methanocellales archaeon]